MLVKKHSIDDFLLDITLKEIEKVNPLSDLLKELFIQNNLTSSWEEIEKNITGYADNRFRLWVDLKLFPLTKNDVSVIYTTHVLSETMPQINSLFIFSYGDAKRNYLKLKIIIFEGFFGCSEPKKIPSNFFNKNIVSELVSNISSSISKKNE